MPAFLSLGLVMSGGFDLARNVISEADRAVAARADDRRRCQQNWDMYHAANGGQWSEADKKVLRDEYRHPAQFNVIGPKVDALIGALVADIPDISWTPVEGQGSLVTEAIAESYHTDKELFNYEKVFIDVFRDAIVHSGDAYAYIDKRYGRKRVKIDREVPGAIVWDPRWMTDDDRDAEIVYRFRYLTPGQLLREYKHKTPEILQAIKIRKSRPADFPTGAPASKQNLVGTVGDEYKIIEKHYLEHIKGVRLIGRREDSEQWVPFPVNKDQAYLEAFAEANQIDWATVNESEYEERVHYVTTVCEALQVALVSHGKSDVQVNGLPFYHFTVKRHGGKDMGIVEDIIDLQQTINKRESLVTEIISKAQGGATLYDEDLFPDPKDWEEFVKNKNKPGYAKKARLNGIQTPFVRTASNEYPSTALDQITRMYREVLPLVSRSSDALSSITDSGDSGILFERKFQLNLIANTLLNRGVRQLINNIGEGYFYLWQSINRDISQTVTFKDGRRVTLNARGPDGMIFNSVAEVPRCQVVVTENTRSPTFRTRKQGMYSELLSNTDPNIAPGHYFLFLKNFSETLDMPEEDKAALKQFNDMAMAQARVSMMKNLTGLQAGVQGDTLQSAQLQMQLDQMTQQQAQPPQPQMGEPGMGQEQGAYPVQLPQEGPQAPTGDPRVNHIDTPEAARVSDLAQTGGMPQTQPMMA